MAITQNTYTGDGTTVLFSFTFPYLETTDIKVSLNGTVTTAYTLANATTIQFNTAPANGVAIRIYRETDDSALAATFYPGSAIRSNDLNDNFTQNLYVTQESTNNAATATTTANTALTNSNTAISTANSAVSTANTAAANAASAVTTAGTATTNASNAVSTATAASINAIQAVNTANYAATTANTAAADAATAISTANAATSTANAASTAAANAVNTANAASSTASSAVSTANTASSNASAAVSTANTASSNATSAVNTANSALSTANAAASAVANAILYDIVANVAAIPGSPVNNDAIEVTNSTGIESFTPLTGVPGGFVGNSGLSVRIVYTTTGNTWTWIQYFPNDPETRYLKTGSTGTVTSTMIADGTIVNADVSASAAIAGTKISPDFGSQNVTTTGTSTAAALIPSSSTVPTNGVYLPAANTVGVATNGAQRVFVGTGGNVGIGPSTSLGAQMDVNTTSTNSCVIRARNDTTSVYLDANNGYSYLNTFSDHPFLIGTNNQERLRITSAGLVGVGTSNPGTILHCNYASATDTYIRTTNSVGTAGFDFGVSSGGEAWVFNRNNSNMYLGTNSAQRVTITSGGDVGFGVTTPGLAVDLRSRSSTDMRQMGITASTWSTDFPAVYLQLHDSAATGSTAGISNAALGALVFQNQTNALIYTNGQTPIIFGTTSAERMRITGGGNVGIGTTSPAYKLHVTDASDVSITAESTSSGAGLLRMAASTQALAAFNSVQSLYGSTESWSIGGAGSQNTIAFKIGTTERARIDSSGRLLVGTSTAPSVVAGYGSGDIQFVNQASVASIANISTVNSGFGAQLLLAKSRGGTSTIVQNGDIYGQIRWAGADGTDIDSTAATIEAVVDGTPNANVMPGRLVFSTTADGASSPTERMRITNSGELRTGGNTNGINIGSTTDTGLVVENNGTAIIYRASSIPLFVGRQTDDGTLVEFRQAGVAEGSISVSGTTVSYNGAHLSRWSQLPSDLERTKILRGTVLSNIDEMCEWGNEENEQLNRMKVSDVEGDKNVSGVFQSWDDDDDTYTNDFYCAMTGDFIIRIAQGVTVERGDLLMSAGDGTAKPQDDDIIRSKTIAKVTSTNVSCTYEDGSYCVPCVLMAC